MLCLEIRTTDPSWKAAQRPADWGGMQRLQDVNRKNTWIPAVTHRESHGTAYVFSLVAMLISQDDELQFLNLQKKKRKKKELLPSLSLRGGPSSLIGHGLMEISGLGGSSKISPILVNQHPACCSRRPSIHLHRVPSAFMPALMIEL